MDLFDLDFASVLPQSIREDAAMLAAATAVQRQLIAVSNLMGQVAIWARLDEITEPLLSTLAWQLHIDDFEGWELAETDAQKRHLIRESLLIHRYKGTRWSVERIFGLLGITGTVSEWFEYGGDPYRFIVSVRSEKLVSDAFAGKLLSLIDVLKNVRSWLDKLTIFEELQAAAPATAGQTAALGEPFPFVLHFLNRFDFIPADARRLDGSGLGLTEAVAEPFPLTVATPTVERLGLDAFPRFDQVPADFAPLDITLEVTHV